MTNIWALFSVVEAYDQPENNLVAWWKEKPSLETLSLALGFDAFPPKTSLEDECIVGVVKLWSGDATFRYSGTHYRLEAVAEGVVK